MTSICALWALAGVVLATAACAPQPRGPESAAKRSAAELTPGERFPTSLHARGPSNGRENVYEDGPGRLTKVPFRDLPCQKCHPETYADGTPVDEASYRPSCRDCHVDPLGNDPVPQQRCLQCHETGFDRYSVHREAGLECMDCHTSNDVHGNGRIQQTMYAPDAIEADCLDCHDEVVGDSIESHRIHLASVDCSACHLETAETCYSCHFESYVEGGYQDRVLTEHSGFILLANDKEGKVHTATYQTIPWKGKTFVGILPIFNHTIMKAEDARDCGDCHDNDAAREYGEDGRIWVARWDEETRSLWLRKGVIPVPPDWSYRLKFDQITYTGSPDDPVSGYPSEDPENWTFVGNVPDLTQDFKDYIDPLTSEQMEALMQPYSEYDSPASR
ncbi:MAG: hypothetical protein JRF15_14650 [Deltaproteobacteria bacterium]|jgi:hypothetical protein|nr:hypothetical protein [Deltaproteobacteria bacterium]